MYHNPDAEAAIASCIAILKHCAERDAQAQRVIYIVEAFHEANLHRPPVARSMSFPNRKASVITATSNGPDHDPMVHFFAHTKHSPRQQLPNIAPSLKAEGSTHTVPVVPVIPSVLQQPSPDATGISPVNAAVMPAGMRATENTHIPDRGFDFDDLWPTWQPPHAAMPVGHHIGPTEGYGHYTSGITAMGIEDVLAGNVNVPLYPPGHFMSS